MTLTMSDRRERGETITHQTPSGPVELVHGRALALDALADYRRINDEGNEIWRTVSPFRSDYDELNRAIDNDLADVATDLADALKRWHEDTEVEEQNRARDICREIDHADQEDCADFED